MNQGDITSLIQTNLNIAMTLLQSSDFDEHILKQDPNFFVNEQQIEAKLKAKLQNRHARKLNRIKSEDSGSASGGNIMADQPSPRKSQVTRRVTVTNEHTQALEQIMEATQEEAQEHQ